MKRNGMKAINVLCVLALAGVLVMALAGCGPAKSESEWTLEEGYDNYFSAVDDAEGLHDPETCSISKAGFEEALRAAAKGAGKEALEDGDADEEDISNLEKTIKTFSADYDDFVDAEDYEPSTMDSSFVDNAEGNLDYRFGVSSAKSDFQDYLDKNGPFVKFADAKEWVSDNMDDLGSFDFFDDVIDEALKDQTSEMEGCWIEVYDARKEQE